MYYSIYIHICTEHVINVKFMTREGDKKLSFLLIKFNRKMGTCQNYGGGGVFSALNVHICYERMLFFFVLYEFYFNTHTNKSDLAIFRMNITYANIIYLHFTQIQNDVCSSNYSHYKLL